MRHQAFAGDIRFYQRLMKIAGKYAGAIDGVWGPQTDAAERAFDAEYDTIRKEMGVFDERSETNIHTLIPVAQREVRRFLTKAHREFPNFNIRIISGTRTYAEQNALYRKGRGGNPGPIVTKAKGGESNHNFGIAWDIGIFQNGRYLTGSTHDEEQAYRNVGKAVVSRAVEWGGSWRTFPDLPHYQLKTSLSLAEIRRRFETGNVIV